MGKRHTAGTEVEAEAILGMLRTRDDLKNKMTGTTRDMAKSPDEEDADDAKAKKNKEAAK